MKTYCRRFGVIAYQNKNNNMRNFQNWCEKLNLKNCGFDISRTINHLEIKIFSEYGYEKTIHLYQNDWLVLELGKFTKYTNQEFKRLFKEN